MRKEIKVKEMTSVVVTLKSGINVTVDINDVQSLIDAGHVAPATTSKATTSKATTSKATDKATTSKATTSKATDKATTSKATDKAKEERQARQSAVKSLRGDIRHNMSPTKAFKFLTDGAKAMASYNTRLASDLTLINKLPKTRVNFWNVAQCDDQTLGEIATHVMDGNIALLFVSNAPYRVDSIAFMYGAKHRPDNDRFAVRQWLNNGGKWVQDQPVDHITFDTPEVRITLARAHYVYTDGKIHGQVHLLYTELK